MFRLLFLATVLACCAYSGALFGQAFRWRDAPESIQEAGKIIAGKNGGRDSDKWEGIFPPTAGLYSSNGLGGIFNSDRRYRFAGQRKYRSEDDLDLFYVENCRKIYVHKKSDSQNNRDDGGRIRILVLEPGTSASGKDGKAGYPRIHFEQVIGPDEGIDRVKRSGNWGNLVVIIYPTKIGKDPKGKPQNWIYYHLESGG